MRWMLMFLILAAGLGLSALLWVATGGRALVLILPLLFLPLVWGRPRR